MSDLRDEQPAEKEFDWTQKTKGNHVFRVTLWCPAYSGIKSEDVYVRRPEFLVMAMSFEDASEKAQIIAAAIREAHDIWQVEIVGVVRQ